MRVEHTYAVPPQRLLAVLTDEAFLRARAERFGGEGTPTVARRDGRITVVTARRLDVEQVPGPVQRLVGDGRVVQTDEWAESGSDRITGTWTTDTGRAPIVLAGTHEIVPAPEGCRYTVTAEVKVSIPVVGGALAKQAKSEIEKLISTEQRFAEKWIAGSA